MTSKRLPLVLLTLLLLSCSHSGLVERKIGAQVENCKQDVPCLIIVKDLTNFEWDKMYVFSYGVRQNEIEKTIGTNFPDYVEFKRRMIFLDDGKITHSESEDTNIEEVTDGQVVFEDLKTEPSYLSFAPDDAAFIATKYKTNFGVAYSLKQIK